MTRLVSKLTALTLSLPPTTYKVGDHCMEWLAKRVLPKCPPKNDHQNNTERRESLALPSPCTRRQFLRRLPSQERVINPSTDKFWSTTYYSTYTLTTYKVSSSHYMQSRFNKWPCCPRRLRHPPLFLNSTGWSSVITDQEEVCEVRLKIAQEQEHKNSLRFFWRNLHFLVDPPCGNST